LLFENNQYRTVPLHLAVSLICNDSAGLKQKDETKTSIKDVLSRQVGKDCLFSSQLWADVGRFESL
jgi:hypothetical protein